MILARLTNVALAAVIVIPHALGAQGAAPRRPIELGVDAALSYESSDPVDGISLTVPVPRLRIGFFLTDAVSLEPSFQFNYSRLTFENPITGEDRTASGSNYELDFGLLYHFSTNRAARQVYIRPLIGINGFSSSDDDDDEDTSASQVVFGVGLGVKLPSTNRLATRLEGGFVHRSEDEPFFRSANRLYASFGFSFFTR
jgi:hypothetical protein